MVALLRVCRGLVSYGQGPGCRVYRMSQCAELCFLVFFAFLFVSPCWVPQGDPGEGWRKWWLWPASNCHTQALLDMAGSVTPLHVAPTDPEGQEGRRDPVDLAAPCLGAQRGTAGITWRLLRSLSWRLG